MKRALLLAALAVGLGAMALTRGGGPAMSPPPPPPRSAPAPTLPPPPSAPLARNPFEFAAVAPEAVVASAAPRGDEHGLAVAPVPPASAAVRLVGFVRQAGRLRVALVVEGESVLLGEGEAASGYELISADVNDGVRLKAPDGAELFVPAPELESGG